MPLLYPCSTLYHTLAVPPLVPLYRCSLEPSALKKETLHDKCLFRELFRRIRSRSVDVAESSRLRWDAVIWVLVKRVSLSYHNRDL